MTSPRLQVLADTLGADIAGVSRAEAARRIENAAGSPNHVISYLVLAVLGGAIPAPDDVKAFTRAWRSSGLASLMADLGRRPHVARRHVIVATGTVVDVSDTLASRFTTGIQRVARETVARWADHPKREVLLVRWHPRLGTFVALNEEEAARVVPGHRVPHEMQGAIIVPFRARLVLPEISVDPRRVTRLRTIARHGGGRAVAIGFDCIPVTTAETAAAGMPGAFSKYLSALARFDAVAPISDAAATEYRGWRRMLAGAGLVGPRIHTVSLPFTTSGAPDPARAARLRDELALGDDPIVLCVGSHEPRKNHLAVLHAAERAWRKGSVFSLVLVGGNSWDTERFDRLVAYLRRRGRRVLTLSGVGDDVIWDLYDLAEFTLFPSLNEGFGLPVVESLSHSIPVITSNFGSMQALAKAGGARLVDPRNIVQLAEAIVALLGDPDELGRLRAEAALIPESDWDAYAEQLWTITQSASG